MIFSSETDDCYRAFCVAAKTGDLASLNRLKTEAPDQLDAMIADEKFYTAVLRAAENGHVDILEWLEKESSDGLQTLFTKNRTVLYMAFWGAAGNGHLAVLEWLKLKAPKELENMINYSIAGVTTFQNASVRSHLHVLTWLKNESSDKCKAAIAAYDYSSFYKAIKEGNPEVLNWFKREAPDQWQCMTAPPRLTNPFCYAAEHGQLESLKWLKIEIQNLPQDIITKAFQEAAQNGHLHILDWFKNEVPEQLQTIIEDHRRYSDMYGDKDWQRYSGFVYAAFNGKLDVLRWFKAESPNNFQRMIEVDDFAAFRFSVDKGHRHVTQYLLPFPTCFAYAETHTKEYGEKYIVPFVTEKLAALHIQQQQSLLENGSTIFDIHDEEEAKLYFYIIKNLIRKNNPTNLDEIRFLIDIPAVKALVHVTTTPNEPNELVRFALTSNNQEAAAILQNVPSADKMADEELLPRVDNEQLPNIQPLSPIVNNERPLNTNDSFYFHCLAGVVLAGAAALVVGILLPNIIIATVGLGLIAVGSTGLYRQGLFSKKLIEKPRDPSDIPIATNHMATA